LEEFEQMTNEVQQDLMLIGEAHSNYLRAIQEMHLGNQVRFEEIQHNYRQELQKYWEQADTQFHHNEAYINYLQSLQELQKSNQENFEQIQRNYLQELQEVWGQLDLSTLAQPSLTAICRSLSSALSFV
jgi:transketolase